MKPMVGGEKPSGAPRRAISVPCRPLPPSRMPAAISSGISGRMEDMLAKAGYSGRAPPSIGYRRVMAMSQQRRIVVQWRLTAARH